MAARKSKVSSGGAMAALKIGCIAFVGLAAGYTWRSFAPLPLPIDSPLAADSSTKNIAADQLKDLVHSATERAEMAEKERNDLSNRLKATEQGQQKAERDLADMKIKSMLNGTP
ncbi:hypothetical protein BH09SUM1_BH09SUM1_08090 [soil metagenome]